MTTISTLILIYLATVILAWLSIRWLYNKGSLKDFSASGVDVFAAFMPLINLLAIMTFAEQFLMIKKK